MKKIHISFLTFAALILLLMKTAELVHATDQYEQLFTFCCTGSSDDDP